MIILVDIGNSRTKFAELVDEQLSVTTILNNSEFNACYFVQHFKNAQRIIIASVANTKLSAELAIWCKKQAITITQVYSEQCKNSVTSAYQEATKLGVDRWLTLLAANHLYPNKHVLIIDAGTATTVDSLAATGQHQGGWILAGINTLVDGILNNTTLVQADNAAIPQLSFGLNTSDNVHNASWAATTGMIHQAIKQAEKISPLEVILITGGNGQELTDLLLLDNSLSSQISKKVHFVDNLIFYGLLQYRQ